MTPQSLILLEHDGQRLKRSSLSAISFARQLGGSYVLMLMGHALAPIVESVRAFGATSVVVMDHLCLAEPLADRYAFAISQVARQVGASHLISASSTFTKDILPRVAAMLDAPMLTDVVALENVKGEVCFKRPVCAGSFMATVKLEAHLRVFAVRATAFPIPEPNCQTSPVQSFDLDASSLPDGMQFVSREERISTRPELTEARVVVSGGRPLKDKVTFDQLINGLADSLGAAVGATRAAVDAGLAPNDCQIGQTGKTIAPELYIAVGVSGAIQHLAGIKDSRIIVAINRDPEAPIFQMANYGLVGDLHAIVPRLIAALRA